MANILDRKIHSDPLCSAVTCEFL